MISRITASLATVIAVAAIGVPTPAAHADEFNICPSGLTGVATADTSCAFADNVRAAQLAQPGPIVSAYSPVTQQTYLMQCVAAVTQIWPQAMRCAGVNTYGANLVVFISTASSGTGSGDQSGTSGQATSTPAAGVGTDSPDSPYINNPGIGCTWVNGYTRSDGTRVRGHVRC